MHEPTEQPVRPRRQSFLIGVKQGSPAGLTLSALLPQLSAEPGMKVTRILGQPNDPQNLVVEMSPEQAEALKLQFGGQLLVEKDTQLDLF